MKKCVIVVAHPDDEAIWCASLPLRFKDYNWFIICVSAPIKGVDRGNKFYDSCKILGAESSSEYAPLYDAGMHIPLAIDRLNLDLERFDHIFTHNSEGEYGHPHHIQVYDYINKHWSHKKLTLFGYRSSWPVGAKSPAQPIHLTDEEIKKKMEAIKAYNHIYGEEPYYNKILRWMKHLPNYNFDIETFEGELP